jgi:hypothetical protein
MFMFTVSLSSAPVAKEAVLLEEMRAKEFYLALDNIHTTYTNASPGTSVVDLLRIYYVTGDTVYVDQARKDIQTYAGMLLENGTAWRVYTTDGILDVRSSFYDDAWVKGSASAPLVNTSTTELVVATGRLD